MTWDRNYEEERRRLWTERLKRWPNTDVAHALAIRDAVVHSLTEVLREAAEADRKNMAVSDGERET